MFFQCNSWRQALLEAHKSSKTSSALFQREFIGIYYRVDTTFVSSMCFKEESRWDVIFETYFAICILQEILDLIITLHDDMTIDEEALFDFICDFSQKLYPPSTVYDLKSFRYETECYLDAIEDKINGVNDIGALDIRYINAHRFIRDLCKACNSMFGQELLYKVFIDEYETLQEYQQKIINTLIKHSELPVIFNIGSRPHGRKTAETISQTETIEAPHDYELVTLSIDSDSYRRILKEICRKRISLAKEQGRIPNEVNEDIEFYLGTYSIEYELEKISQSKFKLPHIERLNSIIKQLGEKEGLSPDQISSYCNTLSIQAPIINSRLHYALLCKQTSYTPSLSTLYKAYTTKSSIYTNWMHNRKYGLIFLLCKESKRGKMYYGFDVFSILSSHIVRYFLELCEQTFKIAFLDDYKWDAPISFDVQTEAAVYVSEYKVIDIAGYEPYGKELRLFTQFLGQIFYRLHTIDNNTVGEPEPNHFFTKDLSLSDKTKHLISSALMWNVLQEGEPTKRKQSKLSPETVDYFINKIYVPYFGISYRNQRKINLDVSILDMLLSGNENEAKNGFREYFKMQSNQPVLNDNPNQQISLFENIFGETI